MVYGLRMSQEPYFDRGSDTIQFWVDVNDVPVRAIVGKATLHYRYHARATDDDPIATYLQNAQDIDDAVRRRVAAGAREPVILRDPDLRALPPS
jgi:hypothetical protein